ncbi:hypothetical protein V6D40_07935 [Corynebacterium sp. Q4381]|uniref:hypothetical protein n=1 Tax=Corynebacterium sp. Marseille-Q4381 TaxID=3121597 RepID=UPI002FE529FF
MKSRTAIALLTAAGLGLTGVASANAANAANGSSSSNGVASATVTATPTTTPIATPTTTYPVTATSTVVGSDGVTTVVESVTAEPTTVTYTPPKPTDASSKMMELSTLSERGQTIFMVINAVLTVLGIAIQVATAVLASNPEMVDQLRAWLESLDI